MGKAAAGVSRRNAIQFQRLPRVVAALLAGQISHDMATAIAAAVSCSGKDIDVSDTEDIEPSRDASLPANHVHRLLHTSQMFRVVVNARARAIDTSYAVRFVPDWIRRLVLLQYPTYSYDNCPIEAQYCDMDHIFNWAQYNRTKADEIIPACGHHNRDRARNPHKYRLEKLPDQRWHFTTTKHQN